MENQERNITFNKNKNLFSNIDINKKHIPSMEYISPLNKKTNKKLIIMIRGHIRDSFKDNRLSNLIFILSQKYNIDVYVHTWNILQSNNSWRKMDKDETIVTRDMIESYFKTVPKQIIIEDENAISLSGNLEGKISNTLCPIICWKYMWYGMNELINQVVEPIETTILNIRFDIFTNRNRLFTIPSIQKSIEQNFNKYLRTNIFIVNEPVIGIDNLMIGSVYTMHKLINHFHNNLDKILENYPDEIHQEFIVFKENKIR
jgi:hypothetical protein